MKQKNKIILMLSVTLSFFLGRESKELVLANNKLTYHNTSSLKKNAITNEQAPFLAMEFNEALQKETDTVYRCGQSKIYHPTTSHSSFKRCKSKVYKLTVARAKELGMRHCKCSG